MNESCMEFTCGTKNELNIKQNNDYIYDFSTVLYNGEFDYKKFHKEE
jgi:hypothetical protein